MEQHGHPLGPPLADVAVTKRWFCLITCFHDLIGSFDPSRKDGSLPFVEFLSDVLDPPVMLVPGANKNDTMLKGSQHSSYT